MTQILFEPKYQIGDVVCLRIAPENKMVIDGYSIKQITAAGEVSFFRYSMYDNEGANFLYSETDVELVEAIKQQ
jgi:hypothetical protein